MDIKGLAKRYGLGLRTMKTALALLICLVTGYALEGQFPIYASVTAVLTMQDTPQKSRLYGKTRLIGTGFGGIIGMAFLLLYSLTEHPALQILILVVAVIVGLMACNILNQKEACTICAGLILVIMLGHTREDIYFYAIKRVVETGFGVVVSLVINRYLYPNIIEEHVIEERVLATRIIDEEENEISIQETEISTNIEEEDLESE